MSRNKLLITAVQLKNEIHICWIPVPTATLRVQSAMNAPYRTFAQRLQFVVYCVPPTHEWIDPKIKRL